MQEQVDKNNDLKAYDYFVIYRDFLPELSHIEWLTDLYQPIIGGEAVALYQVIYFWHLINSISEIDTHQRLLTATSLNITSFKKARERLEAVGLLDTKITFTNKHEKIFFYQCNPPYAPSFFLQSDILSIMLFNRLGKRAFINIKQKYTKNLPEEWRNKTYHNITKSFDQVFQSLTHSELIAINGSETAAIVFGNENYPTVEKRNILLKNNYFDLELLKMKVNTYKGDELWTKELIELLQELTYLYSFTVDDLTRLLENQLLYDEYGRIDYSKLRNLAKKYYHFQHNQELPRIIEKSELEDNNNNLQSTNSVEKEPAKEHFNRLKNYSPEELLQYYHQGTKIPTVDLQLIRQLEDDYQLPHEVINVLLEYVMWTNDYRLPRPLIEKIAGHWKRLNITTMDEALNVAKKEHYTYRQWKNNSNINDAKQKRVGANKGKRYESLPASVKQQMEEVNIKENKPLTEEEIAQERRILELLNSLGN